MGKSSRKSIESNHIPPWIVWRILHPLNKNSTFYWVWDGLGIKYLLVYGKDFGPSLTYRLPMYFSQFVLCRAEGLVDCVPCHVFHSETRPLWDSHMFYPSHHSQFIPIIPVTSRREDFANRNVAKSSNKFMWMWYDITWYNVRFMRYGGFLK